MQPDPSIDLSSLSLSFSLDVLMGQLLERLIDRLINRLLDRLMSWLIYDDGSIDKSIDGSIDWSIDGSIMNGLFDRMFDWSMMVLFKSIDLSFVGSNDFPSDRSIGESSVRPNGGGLYHLNWCIDVSFFASLSFCLQKVILPPQPELCCHCRCCWAHDRDVLGHYRM